MPDRRTTLLLMIDAELGLRDEAVLLKDGGVATARSV